MFVDVLNRGIVEGKFKKGDPKLMALYIMGAANWVHTWYKKDGPLTAAEIGEMFAEYVISGLSL